jgi:hypothetical protein
MVSLFLVLDSKGCGNIRHWFSKSLKTFDIGSFDYGDYDCFAPYQEPQLKQEHLFVITSLQDILHHLKQGDVV